MANKLIPFPKKPTVEPETLGRSHSRLIFTIANQRFAFDFFSRVTELKSTPPPRIFAIDRDVSNNRPKLPD
jgi:hypothetical protein